VSISWLSSVRDEVRASVSSSRAWISLGLDLLGEGRQGLFRLLHARRQAGEDLDALTQAADVALQDTDIALHGVKLHAE